MGDYIADPARRGYPVTGIYVRAQRDGRWDSVDITHLNEESLRAWLRSRGGSNKWAEDTVCILLGHREAQ